MPTLSGVILRLDALDRLRQGPAPLSIDEMRLAQAAAQAAPPDATAAAFAQWLADAACEPSTAGLIDAGSPTAADLPCLAARQKDLDPDVCQAAVAALVAAPGDAAVALLARALRDVWHEVRRTAAIGLGAP